MDRRCFLGSALMTTAFAHLGTMRAEAGDRAPRGALCSGACGQLDQLTGPDAGTPRGESGPRQLLDLHLHQLAPHASLCARLGAEVPTTTRGRRRAHTGVRVRTEHRQRSSSGPADEHRIRRRDRQRLRDLAQLRQSLLAGVLLHRRAGTCSRPALRRRRLRPVGAAHSAVAGGAGASDLPGKALSVEARRVRAGRRLGHLESPETYIGYERAERFRVARWCCIRRASRVCRPGPSATQRVGADGEWTMGPRLPSLDESNGRMCAAFTHAICTSSWAVASGGARFRVAIDGEPPDARARC